MWHLIVFAALYLFLPYVVLLIVGFWILYVVIRSIYHAFYPESERAYLERKAKEAEENRKRKEQEEAEAKAKRERAKAENRAWMEREAKKKRKIEVERQQHRDGDQQTTPYTYQIGKHGNESLAIRYGIANQERKVKEYWYYAKGGEQKRNPDRDQVYYEPASTIRLRKTRKVSKDLYEVLLTDFRERKARAIIETGTEYVKTFYPLDDSWFEKHADLEETLNGNNSFTLKELATFHVQKAVGI
ncbi:cell envelope integrity protein TolA [Methylotuvimicrobium buryatense]|uniref:Uncharacterized protein n=1 Tax=Methylotuvimicrobium buryatense TaxID=95641 RepID=A0A4P9UKI5_METBY|nr:cell envelope integrity protein TolA [Methylotuvimicrobium buryatense]QCW81000.1 hypothetical protein EQU24_01075 [Methylotuvimicrobium buryatense]